jgi:hypothetical protein
VQPTATLDELAGDNGDGGSVTHDDMRLVRPCACLADILVHRRQLPQIEGEMLDAVQVAGGALGPAHIVVTGVDPGRVTVITRALPRAARKQSGVESRPPDRSARGVKRTALCLWEIPHVFGGRAARIEAGQRGELADFVQHRRLVHLQSLCANLHVHLLPFLGLIRPCPMKGQDDDPWIFLPHALAGDDAHRRYINVLMWQL